MRKLLVLVAVLGFGVGMGAWLRAQEQGVTPKPKHAIDEVMDGAHGKSKLLNKVIRGSATKAEKDQLLDLYISLVDNKPPRGEPSDWLMRSGRLVVAAARVAVGREGADAELKAASNCKACHDLHK